MNSKPCLAFWDDCLLYGILDMGYVAEDKSIEVTQKLIAGGIKILQLRAKGWEVARIEKLARQVVPICKKAGVAFIINDFWELTLSVEADGVHIGQDDGAICEIREKLGPEKIIGRSTHSLAQAIQAEKDGADYIGFGPLFPTQTKPGRPAIGLSEISEVHQCLGAFPIFCIGGIQPDNLVEICAAGAQRAVVVSAILKSQNITASTHAIVSFLKNFSVKAI